MTKEELDKIQVGDKVLFLEGYEGIVIVIEVDNDDRFFVCLDKRSIDCLEQWHFDLWKEKGFPIIENFQDYLGEKFDKFFDFKSCEFKNRKPVQSNKCGKCGMIDEYASYSNKHKEVRCYRCC